MITVDALMSVAYKQCKGSMQQTKNCIVANQSLPAFVLLELKPTGIGAATP